MHQQVGIVGKEASITIGKATDRAIVIAICKLTGVAIVMVKGKARDSGMVIWINMAIGINSIRFRQSGAAGKLKQQYDL